MESQLAIDIEGETLELLTERALFWKKEKALVCADLHWGKSDTFRALGVPIPDAIADDELKRLTRAVERTGAQKIWVLGDLVHARVGLTDNLGEKIERWRKEVDVPFVVVKGNHDRIWKKVPTAWGIEWRDELESGPFKFTHEPRAHLGKYTWAGHLHPTFRLSGGYDRVRLPCFHVGKETGILPAFSDFTRGLVMKRQGTDRIFVLTGNSILELPRQF